MATSVRPLDALLVEGAQIPKFWGGKVFIDEDNLTYCVWNTETKEALVVDPCEGNWGDLSRLPVELPGFRWIAVIDTHTHADHVSSAAQLATHLSAPLIQHSKSPSQRVTLRVSRDTQMNTQAGVLTFLESPGHTPDSLTILWGPFIFTGDTLLHGDTGRDDLPGGDPHAHWESLQKLKRHASPTHLVCPGHDAEGGRVSTWAFQLKHSVSLTQDCEIFFKEAAAYSGPAPKLLKESLFANFK